MVTSGYKLFTYKIMILGKSDPVEDHHFSETCIFFI